MSESSDALVGVTSAPRPQAAAPAAARQASVTVTVTGAITANQPGVAGVKWFPNFRQTFGRCAGAYVRVTGSALAPPGRDSRRDSLAKDCHPIIMPVDDHDDPHI
eukprot:3872759-Rhodomonas_salina.1